MYHASIQVLINSSINFVIKCMTILLKKGGQKKVPLTKFYINCDSQTGKTDLH